MAEVEEPEGAPLVLEAASIQWFVTFMRLHDVGLVPTVTPRELMPSREAVAEFMGPKVMHGFVFDDHGSPEYARYVTELFTRVLQLNWPCSSVVPFHFARGLVAEAAGEDVNWAEFAYKMTHPHQSHTGVPRIFPEYAALLVPLPPLVKVIPVDDVKVSQNINLPQNF